MKDTPSLTLEMEVYSLRVSLIPIIGLGMAKVMDGLLKQIVREIKYGIIHMGAIFVMAFPP